MDEMKYDMSGAGSVLGTMRYDRRNELETQRDCSHPNLRKHAVWPRYSPR